IYLKSKSSDQLHSCKQYFCFQTIWFYTPVSTQIVSFEAWSPNLLFELLISRFSLSLPGYRRRWQFFFYCIVNGVAVYLPPVSSEERIIYSQLQMFKNTFQSGFLSILYSLGSKPLQIWDKEGQRSVEENDKDVVSNGDGFLSSASFEIMQKSVSCNFYWPALAFVNGQVKRTQDEDIQSNILEIVGTNVQSTYITCPADPAATLGIKLPFLVMIVKNVKKYFTFEIQVLDDKNVRRRFRASNFQV
ncbi:hypothetical protein Ccrd_021001, partial [Cynara cardunculus var. scolymus]